MRTERGRRASRYLMWLGAVIVGGDLAQGQTLVRAVNGFVRIQNGDLAVMEAGETRKDLPCVVSPSKPFLGFDLRFHGGYDVAVPLRELAGSENLLTVLFRVYPQGQRERAQYFIQRIKVPQIEEDAKGEAFLQGGFDVGEGNYHIDWLMRDRAERVCAFSWDTEAALGGRDRQVQLAIAPGTVEAPRPEQFQDEPPVERSTAEAPLNIKVLMNFAPQKMTAATIRPLDTTALVAILRTLFRDPRVGKFTLVAFNLQEQKIFFRQEGVERLDFKALGESLDSVSFGTVDLKLLAEKNSDTNFLGDLITKELAGPEQPDAVVIAGPKAMLEANVPEEQLKKLGQVDYPVFYMNYILNPQQTPWRDTIGNAVRALRGQEFTISRPRDLWYAVTEIVSRVVKFRNAKQVASVSSK